VKSKFIVHTAPQTLFYIAFNMKVKSKDIEIPLQAWTGPEGSRRLRLPDFKTVST